MKQFFRHTISIFAVTALLLSGCAQFGDNQPYTKPYQPLAHKYSDHPDWALHSVARILEIRGYDISQKSPYLATFTEPQELGELETKNTQEKYTVSHQIGVEIINPPEGPSYWRIQHKIKGISKETKAERYFPPQEFAKTEKIFGEISEDITTMLSSDEF